MYESNSIHHMIDQLSNFMTKLKNMHLELISTLIFLMLLSPCECNGGGLSYDFYDKSCPQVESIVRAGVRSISLVDPTSPAALLRLMFHDCQVQGCDASILVDQDGMRIKSSEIASSKNFGIRKRNSISLIKSTVEAVCPQQVSCADILIMAARDAVALSGGPTIDVPLGRRDSSSPPNSGLADASLPPADIGLDGMLQLFSKKGMTIEESVAILGAHTLGITHCLNLERRLYKKDQENRPGNNATTNPGFELGLRMSCPFGSSASRISFVQNDLTAVIFDNQYFANLMMGRGLLTVDSEMPADSRTGPYVEKFANDEDAFFRAFSSAFVKISSSGVLTGNRGVIRRSCNELN